MSLQSEQMSSLKHQITLYWQLTVAVAVHASSKTLREKSLLPDGTSTFRYVASTSADQSYKQESTPALYQTVAPLPLNNYTAAPLTTFALLGSHCTGNSYCGFIPNSICVNGVCACNNVTVPLGHFDCLSLANAFGDTCTITAQCKKLDNLAVCYVSFYLCFVPTTPRLLFLFQP